MKNKKEEVPDEEKRVGPDVLFELRNLVKDTLKFEKRMNRAVAEFKSAMAKADERVYEALLALDVEDPTIWRIDPATGKLERKPKQQQQQQTQPVL